jgi:hypothetical protein
MDDAFVHPRLVTRLLNDLFGIQSRACCLCAGPYWHRLLGIDLRTSREFEKEILAGEEGIKPGWVRVNFNYFFSETVFDFILRAVHLVASEGWKLLPHYRFDPATGRFWHRSAAEPPMSLAAIRYESGAMEYATHHASEPESALPGYLEKAQAIIEQAVAGYAGEEVEPTPLPEGFERLRWFPLPHEILAELKGREPHPPAAGLLHV